MIAAFKRSQEGGRIMFIPPEPIYHPHKDRAGYYSTFDAIKIFGMKWGRLKSWIEEAYISPRYSVHEKRGKKSYFTERQLYAIRVFEKVVDFGISRKIASMCFYSFDQAWKQKVDTNVDFIIFELEDGLISAIDFHAGEINLAACDNYGDLLMMDFRAIYRDIKSGLEKLQSSQSEK